MLNDIDRLMQGEHLALFGGIIENEVTIFSAIARFAREKKKTDAAWRVVILSDNYRSRTTPFFQKFMRRSDAPAGKITQTYFTAGHGRIYCSPAELEFIQGIAPEDTLWVVLDSQKEDIWDRLATVVPLSIILAVNPPYKRLYLFPGIKEEYKQW